jgi:hypothetical protein
MTKVSNVAHGTLVFISGRRLEANLAIAYFSIKARANALAEYNFSAF